MGIAELMVICWLKCAFTYPQQHDGTQTEALHKNGPIHLWHNISEGRGYKEFNEVKTCCLQAATLVIVEEMRATNWIYIFAFRLKAVYFERVSFWSVGRKEEKESVFILHIISDRKLSFYRRIKKPLIKA